MPRPIVTNISSAVRPRGCDATGATVVAIEANGPLEYEIQNKTARHLLLRITGAETRMPEATIAVHDGLLATIGVTRRPNELELTLTLDHPTTLVSRKLAGIPTRLNLELSRAPLFHLMHGRKIAIDPGHGGSDRGGRGPVDLEEKKMTLAVGRLLPAQLADLGCLTTLTRTDDVDLSWQTRLATAASEHAEAMVSLHTAWFPDPTVVGIGVSWLNQTGQLLAERIHSALLRKLPLPDRSLGPGRPASGLCLPVVVVEFATISNPVEEGWLRSSTFRKRVAGAVVNGLKDYFAGSDLRRPGLHSILSA